MKKNIPPCFILLVFLLLTPIITLHAQLSADSGSVDSLDSRPLIMLTGKLHEHTFDVMEIDTLEEDESDKPRFVIGGAVRFNYFVRSWEGEEANQNKWGDMAFDMFRVNVTGEMEGITLNIEYRFYPEGFGGPMPHSAWAGYSFNERNQIQIGLHQVPFGNQTYNSDNWFFNLTYYLGLEDDYDLGIKYIHSGQKWGYELAFYKNSELPASDFGRYSYDFVGDFEESNQLNGKLLYFLSDNTRLGVSTQWGQIYNLQTDEFGSHYAAALHIRGDYNHLGLKLEALVLGADIPQNQPMSEGESLGADIITMGAYGSPYNVAYQGELYTASLSYKVPVEWGPISQLVFYDNYSYYAKSEASYADTQMNVLGTMISAGPIYTYIDFASGVNHPWLGPDYNNALAEGSDDARWHTRFNINIGYYF